MSTQLVIETKTLRRVFRSGKGPVEAVRGVDLQVRRGEIFGFLGPNGAGKTTTLRMLATLLQPTSGEATVAGCDLRRDAAGVRRRIGYVSQAGGTDRQITGRAELVFQARVNGMTKREAQVRAAELLRRVELEEAADRRSGTYSGGQRRRLDVALGLVHRPPLLFLDEPTTGLDPQARAHLWDEVRRLRETGVTVFLTTHYLDEADALCDQLAIIDHGTIVAEGSPAELKRQVAGDLITIGVTGDAPALLAVLERQPFVREAAEHEGTLRLYVERGESAMPALLRLIDGTGAQIETLSLTRPSLDDVFLRQTGRSLRDQAA